MNEVLIHIVSVHLFINEKDNYTNFQSKIHKTKKFLKHTSWQKTHNNTQYHETPKKQVRLYSVTIRLFIWIKWLKANTLSIPNTSKSVDKWVQQLSRLVILKTVHHAPLGMNNPFTGWLRPPEKTHIYTTIHDGSKITAMK